MFVLESQGKLRTLQASFFLNFLCVAFLLCGTLLAKTVKVTFVQPSLTFTDKLQIIAVMSLCLSTLQINLALLLCTGRRRG